MTAMMLAMQVMRIGVDKIGPVTMGLLIVNSVLFYYDLDLPFSTDARDVCIGAHQVVHHGQWHRILLHAFFHGSSMHLYYNMSSLLLKGRLLEPVMGLIPFVWLILTFSISTGALLTFLTLVLDPWFPHYHFASQCAIGFSGVLFALNTILPYVLIQPEQSNIMGIQLPTKYLTIFELVMISFLVPNASFLGHLCGICIGYLFVTRKFDFFFRMPELLLLPDPNLRNANQAGMHQNPPPNAANRGLFVDEAGVLRRR